MSKPLIEWKLNLDAPPASFPAGWYEGLINGRIDLRSLIADPDQLDIAETAITNLEDLLEALTEAGLWKES